MLHNSSMGSDNTVHFLRTFEMMHKARQKQDTFEHSKIFLNDENYFTFLGCRGGYTSFFRSSKFQK